MIIDDFQAIFNNLINQKKSLPSQQFTLAIGIVDNGLNFSCRFEKPEGAIPYEGFRSATLLAFSLCAVFYSREKWWQWVHHLQIPLASVTQIKQSSNLAPSFHDKVTESSSLF